MWLVCTLAKIDWTIQLTILASNTLLLSLFQAEAICPIKLWLPAPLNSLIQLVAFTSSSATHNVLRTDAYCIVWTTFIVLCCCLVTSFGVAAIGMMYCHTVHLLCTDNQLFDKFGKTSHIKMFLIQKNIIPFRALPNSWPRDSHSKLGKWWRNLGWLLKVPHGSFCVREEEAKKCGCFIVVTEQ